MLSTEHVTTPIDLQALIAEIDRYAVDADFDTALDDLQREFAEHLHESNF